jgi:crotonobetainyl-CoA:carnitine CoA-transferase CaiB-like acyl-CoA transferase
VVTVSGLRLRDIKVVFERPDLAKNSRFVMAHQRALHREALIEILEPIIAQQPCAHRIGAQRHASGPGRSVSQALDSPAVAVRGLVQAMNHPQQGAVRLVGPTHHMAAQRTHDHKSPPLLGEDTMSFLRDVLGWDDGRIKQLLNDGVMTQTAEEA